jgi:hypothetical protein
MDGVTLKSSAPSSFSDLLRVPVESTPMATTEKPARDNEEAVFRARVSMVRSFPARVNTRGPGASGQLGIEVIMRRFLERLRGG